MMVEGGANMARQWQQNWRWRRSVIIRGAPLPPIFLSLFIAPLTPKSKNQLSEKKGLRRQNKDSKADRPVQQQALLSSSFFPLLLYQGEGVMAMVLVNKSFSWG